jgi:hypothetical protein
VLFNLPYIKLLLKNLLSKLCNNLFSGLLGTITKTAESSECPGKCIHALASLLCDEVREDIPCPGEGLRCCIDRRRSKPNQQQQQQQQQQKLQQASGNKIKLNRN